MAETPLGEFTIPRHPRRIKPHRETGSVAAPPLTLMRLAMAPPRRPIRASALLIAVSHPFHHVQLGLDRGHPFVYIKS
jgi:hypothetical protein